MKYVPQTSQIFPKISFDEWLFKKIGAKVSIWSTYAVSIFWGYFFLFLK